jgi:peroxiredoxin
MRSRASLIILGGLAIGVGIGFVALLGLEYYSNTNNPNPAINSAAPDFLLQNIIGDEVRLSQYRGSPVLINFWATWCQPCQIEMEHIQNRYYQYNPDMVVLGVNFNEPLSSVQEFIEEQHLTFDVVLDNGGRIQELYQIRGYPTTYFVDSEGIIRVIHIGFMTEDQLDGYLMKVGVGG